MGCFILKLQNRRSFGLIWEIYNWTYLGQAMLMGHVTFGMTDTSNFFVTYKAVIRLGFLDLKMTEDGVGGL